MVVHSCSEQAKKTYEEKIVALIDQIRTQSEEYITARALSRYFKISATLESLCRSGM